MSTPIDVNAIINTILPLVMFVLVFSILTDLMKEFRASE